MPEELLHVSRRPREVETVHARLEMPKRGKAPRVLAPFEKPRVHTPANAREVIAALRRVWNDGYMRGPASQQALCVLLGQWGVETAHPQTGIDGQACHNWNLAGIKTAKPETEWHFRMLTPDDFPAREAEALVAHHKRLRPTDPHAFFDDDKNLAGPGKLRVWQIACFRSSDTLDGGARLFIGTVAHFSAALPFMHAGEPERYAHALSDESMGKNKGWFNAASKAYQTGIRSRFTRYMAMNL